VKLTAVQLPRAGRIRLRCPECGRVVVNAEREPHDPPAAVLLELVCDKHDEFDDPHYYDRDGNEVDGDPDGPSFEGGGAVA